MKQRYEILNRRFQLLPEEYEQYKDFDKLVADYQKTPNGSRFIYGIYVAVALVIAFAGYFIIDLNISEEKAIIEQVALTASPSPTEPENVRSLTPVNTNKDKNQTEDTDKAAPESTGRQLADQLPEQPQTNKQGKKEITYDYINANPVEGFPALYDYFEEELDYPVDALADSVKCTCIVSFIIGKEGEITNINVIQSLGPAFDTESVRLIENMPPWHPATVNGSPVKSKLSIPIHFNIK